MSEPAVPQLSPSALRRSILVHLRRSGPSSPDAIATALGASRSGVAQQLRALDSAGLVTRTAERHGVGRPRNLYDVTADAQDLFPSNYDGLATGLLAAIMEIGGDSLVEDVFAARRRQAGAALRARLDAVLPADAPLSERVVELARIQDEQGYISEARVDGDGIRLDTDGWCRRIVAEHRQRKEAVPGFGHALHKPDDPRTPPLLRVARDNKLDGRYVQLLLKLSTVIDETAGRHVTINATGALAALLLEIGIPPEIVRAIAVVSRYTPAWLDRTWRSSRQESARHLVKLARETIPYRDPQG